MKKIRVWVQTNKVGSRCETVFEVSDDEAEEDITEQAKDHMFDMIEWDWRELNAS